MDTKKLLTIVTIILATMVVSLSSFIAGMFIPRPGLVGGGSAVVNQPANNAPPQRPPFTGKKPSQYKIGKPYSVAMQKSRPVIAVFYVDWCHFCQSFMPKFQQLSKMYRGKVTFTAVNAEDPKNADLAKEYNIRAFPSVFLINPATKEKEQIEGSSFESVESMKKAIDSYLERHSKK